MIDWKFALATAERLSRPGPTLDRAEVADVMGDLRESATMAVTPVREFTGLTQGWHSPVLVVDRPRWVEANLQSFEVVMGPVDAKLTELGKAPQGPLAPKIAGAEIGAIMAFLAGKVLGQFDPFWTSPIGDAGRLLLVAPNIVHVERELEVDPTDFRRWVCLHEETHRAQLTGVPWMRDHLLSLVTEVVDTMAPDGAGDLTANVSVALAEVLRIVRGQSEKSLSEVFQSPEQAEVIGRVTGLMSLLEGHADVVMDDIGPEVIPTVRTIRKKFDQRRRSPKGLAGVVRRLMGFESKMRQYRDGATFVRAIHDTVGREGFDAVWAAPEQLPSREEILEPDLWIKRVLD